MYLQCVALNLVCLLGWNLRRKYFAGGLWLILSLVVEDFARGDDLANR